MTSYPRAFVAPSWGLGFEEPARWTSRSTASIPTFPIPSKAAGALPDGWCALPATVVFGVLGFFVIYFGAPFVYLSGPGTVTAPRHVVSLPYTVQVSQMKLVPGATVKAGEEIAEVISPEQDSIVRRRLQEVQ